VKLDAVVDTSGKVTDVPGRKEKVSLLAALLQGAEPAEVEVVVRWLSGELRQGRVGVGYAQVRDLEVPAAPDPTLEVLEVDRALDELKEIAGAGSQGRRRDHLHALFARATEREQGFLVRLLVGELRQGALEGVMVDALAKASTIPAATVRRAWMMSGDLGKVAHEAFAGGEIALGAYGVELFRPLQPMLADTAEDVGEALGRVDRPVVEWKLDGARIQVHKRGDEVKVYTRALREVTSAVPEVVDHVRALGAGDLVLDGEVIALRPDGRPHPFQTTMRRFGRKTSQGELGGLSLKGELPLTPYFFDCLAWDGTTLLDLPLAERMAPIQAIAPGLVVPRVTPTSLADAEAFFAHAMASGHEGVMVKDLATPYAAGARGASWLKVKPSITLDLVVLAVEWGSGRRTGLLSNLHLGARDPAGGFVMLGKTFKGLTDEMLAWQTAHLLAIATEKSEWVVKVRPELVVEIAFNDVQESSRYPGGVALRFARVKAHRPDKSAAQADTIDTVREIFDRSRR
jgi:DNA ligase 1